MLGAKLDNCQLLETQDWEVGALVDAQRGVLVGIDWRSGAVSGSWFASGSLNGPNGNNRAATILPPMSCATKGSFDYRYYVLLPLLALLPTLGSKRSGNTSTRTRFRSIGFAVLSEENLPFATAKMQFLGNCNSCSNISIGALPCLSLRATAQLLRTWF